MACLRDLPDEILCFVLTELKIDVREIDPYEPTLDRQGGLWALSLVSRRFNSLATPILADNLWCDGPRWPSLCRFLLAHQGIKDCAKQIQIDLLGDYLPSSPNRGESDELQEAESRAVHAIVRDIPSVDGSLRDELTECTQTSFAAFLLHWLPNLQFICLIRPGEDELEDGLEDDIQDDPLARTLQASCIPGATFLTKLWGVLLGPPLADPRGRETDLAKLIRSKESTPIATMLAHPALRVLECNSIRPYPWSIDISTRVSQVEELYLRNVGMIGSDIKCIVGACNGLKVLQIADSPWDPYETHDIDSNTLVACVELHSTTLVEVWLYFVEGRCDDIQRSGVFRRCPKLKCLYLGASEFEYRARDGDEEETFPGEGELGPYKHEPDMLLHPEVMGSSFAYFLPTLDYLCVEPYCGETPELYFLQLNREIHPKDRYKPRYADIPSDMTLYTSSSSQKSPVVLVRMDGLPWEPIANADPLSQYSIRLGHSCGRTGPAFDSAMVTVFDRNLSQPLLGDSGPRHTRCTC